MPLSQQRADTEVNAECHAVSPDVRCGPLCSWGRAQTSSRLRAAQHYIQTQHPLSPLAHAPHLCIVVLPEALEPAVGIAAGRRLLVSHRPLQAILPTVRRNAVRAFQLPLERQGRWAGTLAITSDHPHHYCCAGFAPGRRTNGQCFCWRPFMSQCRLDAV